MSTEPERDIEKTLKAYADKRREEAGAPLELHPATRRLLLGEAARAGPKPKQRAGFWWKLGGEFRPRGAFWAIVLLLAGVCAGLLLPTLSRTRRSAQKIPISTDRATEYASDYRERASHADQPANSPAPAAAAARDYSPPGV